MNNIDLLDDYDRLDEIKEPVDIMYLRTSTTEQNPKLQLIDTATVAPAPRLIIYERQSAWKDNINNRPKFKHVVSLIEKGLISSINVWDLDRLYRNRLLQAEFMVKCNMYNCTVRSFRQKFIQSFEELLSVVDKSSPMYWFVEKTVKQQKENLIEIFGYMAEEESRKKSDRIKNAIKKVDGITKSYNGKRWGRKSLPKRVEKEVLELRAKGLSYSAIVKEVTYYDKNKNIKNISKTQVCRIIKENS